MGLRELALYLRGLDDRERNAWRRTAALMADMRNLWSRSSTTPAEILGEAPLRPSGDGPDAQLDEEAAMARARDEAAGKAANGWLADFDEDVDFVDVPLALDDEGEDE